MGRHLQLLLDLDLEATPIGGRVYSDLQPAGPFHGWLELGLAIEELRVAALAGTEPFADAPRLRVMGLPNPTSQGRGITSDLAHPRLSPSVR